MAVITARIQVAEDGTISGRVPDGIRPGEHEFAINVSTTPKRRLSVKDMPVHDEPCDNSISLRREDMYGDDGR
jgi:hypothetical protein